MKRTMLPLILAASLMLTASAFAAEAATTDAATEEAAEKVAFEAPVVLTSIGQSADVDIANTLCTRAGIEVLKDAKVSADTLPADCKTLILAVGGSSKGLGAAGIDADQELARTEALLKKAEEQGVKILAMHTGGTARRGTLSDSFIVPAFGAADAAIVVSEGDEDHLMKDILDENGAELIYVKKAAECIAILQDLFG